MLLRFILIQMFELPFLEEVTVGETCSGLSQGRRARRMPAVAGQCAETPACTRLRFLSRPGSADARWPSVGTVRQNIGTFVAAESGDFLLAGECRLQGVADPQPFCHRLIGIGAQKAGEIRRDGDMAGDPCRIRQGRLPTGAGGDG